MNIDRRIQITPAQSPTVKAYEGRLDDETVAFSDDYQELYARLIRLAQELPEPTYRFVSRVKPTSG